MTLTWSKPRRWHMVSECGRYSVAKALVGAAPRYSAWRLSTDTRKAPHLFLGVTETPAEAQRLAEEHLKTETCST